jgi:hypothetical protein
MTVSALPLLWTPDVVVVPKLAGGFRAAIRGALLFAADGWIAAGYVFVWQIALFRITAGSVRRGGGLLPDRSVFRVMLSPVEQRA